MSEEINLDFVIVFVINDGEWRGIRIAATRVVEDRRESHGIPLKQSQSRVSRIAGHSKSEVQSSSP